MSMEALIARVTGVPRPWRERKGPWSGIGEVEEAAVVGGGSTPLRGFQHLVRGPIQSVADAK